MRVFSPVLRCSFPALELVRDFPALYRVAGVASDDVLNIRAEPHAEAGKIGAFKPDQRGIEVVKIDAPGNWAKVNSQETAGWTAMRFLEREAGDGYPLA